MGITGTLSLVTLSLMSRNLVLSEKGPEKRPDKRPDKKSIEIENRINQVYALISDNPSHAQR